MFSQNCHIGWPKITFDHISHHFRSMHNFFFWFFLWSPVVILEVRSAPKTIGFFHYVLSMAMPNVKLIGEFMTKLGTPQAFWAFLYKMAAILFCRLMPKIIGFLLSGTSMAMVNINLIGVLVTKLWPVQALACGGGATKNTISPKFSDFGDIINTSTHINTVYLWECFHLKYYTWY